MENKTWHEWHTIAMNAVSKISKKQIHIMLIDIFPVMEGEDYIGSLANHYRGRLKYEGKESLIDQMCANSLKRLIKGLTK